MKKKRKEVPSDSSEGLAGSDRFLRKLAESLFSSPEERESFVTAMNEGKADVQALAWFKERPDPFPFVKREPAPFQPFFVDALSGENSAGRNELHEKGYYYCLDLSSVFSSSVFTGVSVSRQHPLVLDMCSAPGGKTALASLYLSPELLVCNEVIGKRTRALISNLKRCSVGPSIVTSSDSSFFAREYPSSFDLVVVDAPCSGQSLIARGEKSPGCFHPSTINMNSNRQKRIIANSIAALRPGSFLAYMTCTFSRQENEGVIEWAKKKFPWVKPVEVTALNGFQSALSDFPCYRLFPQQGYGAGAFTCLLKDEREGEGRVFSKDGLRVLWGSDSKDNSGQ